MPISIAFWVLMIIWLIIGITNSWNDRAWAWTNAFQIVVFCLLFLLGWRVFGFIVQ